MKHDPISLHRAVAEEGRRRAAVADALRQPPTPKPAPTTGQPDRPQAGAR